jgi:3-dehydroquinate synthetase
MGRDKKKSAGRLKFALPIRIGKVQEGIEAPQELITGALMEITEAA